MLTRGNESHDADADSVPIEDAAGLAVSQGSARFVVDDVGHEPRRVRLSGALLQHLDAEIWLSAKEIRDWCAAFGSGRSAKGLPRGLPKSWLP